MSRRSFGPGGRLRARRSHALASLLGADPKHALDKDLVRFKSLLEDGKTSVRGQRAHERFP
jgi:uncharacterized membrane protein